MRWSRAWLEIAPDSRPRRISGFRELFASANNTHANTCAHLSLMRPGLSSITSLVLAHQPCSTIQALKGYLSLTRPGHYSIISLDQQSLSHALNVVINPHKLGLLLTASRDKAFLSNPFRSFQDTVH